MPVLSLQALSACDHNMTVKEAPASLFEQDTVEQNSIIQLQRRFNTTRRCSAELVSGLSEADAQLQSMADASPSKWHLAHTTWFFERMLLAEQDTSYRFYNEHYNFLFNSYYNGIGEQYRRAQRALISRPSLQEVMIYREFINEQLNEFFSQDTMLPDVFAMIELGIHHEQQHQELLLTDIKHAFSFNPLAPCYRPQAEPSPSIATPLRWMSFDGGVASIGAKHGGFAFDNERPQHRVMLTPYRLASRPVSNAEFIEFIEDGAYQTPSLWLSDGWAWCQQQEIKLPLYWRQRDGHYSHFTLHGQRKVDPNAPVSHVNYYEADAFASWAGKRLPTEFEWEAATLALPIAGHFLDMDRLTPQCTGTKSHQASQFFGGVWEWTRSAYSAYPGFRPFAGLAGEYNGKFMNNQYVLRGGSCLTPPGHVRRSYRNFFHAPDSWQMTGIRLAEDAL